MHKDSCNLPDENAQLRKTNERLKEDVESAVATGKALTQKRAEKENEIQALEAEHGELFLKLTSMLKLYFSETQIEEQTFW